MSKPEYRIPSMKEIERVRGTAGYSLVSTFSGCGGACLGYEMAGFNTLYASEFVREARETYELNHPGVFIDPRDIRNVNPGEILEKIGLFPGELDVLEGSPPCSSFSTSGNREKDWGKVKKYSDRNQQTDDLFFEFARILDGLQPKVFTAENVAGLVKGSAKGYFKEIFRELQDCGYRVEAKVLDAKWLGIPQTRTRLFFMGVRNDLETDPIFPSPLQFTYSINDACPWITNRGEYGKLNDDWFSRAVSRGHPENIEKEEINPVDISRQGTNSDKPYAIYNQWLTLKPGESSQKYINLIRSDADKPCPCVTQTAGVTGAAGITHPSEPRKFTIPELKQLCSFPEDFHLTGNFKQRWERLGRAVPPLMSRAMALKVKEILDNV
jgi:DNA (cytosine-5)-methyltransferase 1